MARLRFIAAGHQGQTCAVFGRDFPHGEWVDAEGMDPDHAERLAENPTFEADLGSADLQSAKGASPKRKSGPEVRAP